MDDLPRFGDSEAGPMSVDNEVEEPMATTSSQEQSNEVSTESHFELASSTHSPAAAAASTSGVTASEEPVSQYCNSLTNVESKCCLSGISEVLNSLVFRIKFIL